MSRKSYSSSIQANWNARVKRRGKSSAHSKGRLWIRRHFGIRKVGSNFICIRKPNLSSVVNTYEGRRGKYFLTEKKWDIPTMQLRGFRFQSRLITAHSSLKERSNLKIFPADLLATVQKIEKLHFSPFLQIPLAELSLSFRFSLSLSLSLHRMNVHFANERVLI